jgi:hypothetical protein
MNYLIQRFFDLCCGIYRIEVDCENKGLAVLLHQRYLGARFPRILAYATLNTTL